MQSRKALITKASWISLFGNLILAILKVTIGFIASSLAVIGDGIDSSVDIIISLVAIIAATYITKPPNTKFAYGFERADAIAAKTLSFFIFFAGGQLLISSIKRLINHGTVGEPSIIAVYVLVLSILAKIGLSIYLYGVGRKAQSSMLIANAKNMKYDVAISISVLASLFLTHALKSGWIDAVAAILVSLWVIKGAFEIFIETNIELMDGIKDPEKVYQTIFDACAIVDGVSHPHRTRTRKVGNKYEISLDIEVDGDLCVRDAHALAHEVEHNIREKLLDQVFDVMIHIEPTGHDMSKEEKGVTESDV